MTTEVATQEKAGLPQQADAFADLGMSAQDLVIDRILLMQNVSERVGDGDAKLGDMVLSTSGEVVADVDRSLEVIPLALFKTWRIMDMTKQPAEFIREEPMTPANEKQEWEFTEKDEHGKDAARRRDYGLHFFVLLADQVTTGDAFPVLVSFRRTSTKAGKALATLLFKQVALGKPVFAKTALISVGKEKFNTNTYAIFQVGPGKPTSPEGLEAAKLWAPRVAGMKAKVDWSKERDAEPQASGPVAAPVVVVGEDAPGTSVDGPY